MTERHFKLPPPDPELTGTEFRGWRPVMPKSPESNKEEVVGFTGTVYSCGPRPIEVWLSPHNGEEAAKVVQAAERRDEALLAITYVNGKPYMMSYTF